MLGIDSKLYEYLSISTQIIFVSGICFAISIPLYTLPIAVYLYCLFVGNIVSGRKLFCMTKLNQTKVVPSILLFLVGVCILYNTLMVAGMKDFFVSRLIISLLISVLVMANILVIETENSFFENLRFAFFYSFGYLHKTILVIFIYIQVMSMFNGFLSVYAVCIISMISFYYIFKWNYKSLMEIQGLEIR